MGVVWHGRHGLQGTEVAVKVLTRRGLEDPRLRRALRDEVHAVAALHHPHIIWVYDHGDVDARAEEASQGALPRGSPWLAMEYAAEGTLSQRRAELTSWRVVRDVLLRLLDALAHAHARGVIHRDIKAANVLYGGARPGLKLSDFGMVGALDGDFDTEPTGGTPSYMAPEQFTSGLREQGPPTDLYSLGCLAFALVGGRRPFRARTWPELAMLHLNAEVPRLEPRFAVPIGLEEWLRRLLRKAPTARFLCAADAAWALEQLGPVRSVAPTARSRPEVEPDTLPLAPEPTQDLPAMHNPAAAGRELETRHQAPPVPMDWRRPVAPRLPRVLLGAGAGLHGVRRIPLVGREDERDALWAALLEVMRDGGQRVVVLRGATGVGKTRLGRWLLRRAAEVGGAVAFEAVHNPTPSPGTGLGGLVMRHLRCAGLGPRATAERLQRVLQEQDVTDPYEAQGLAALVHPHAPDGIGFDDPVQRYVLLRRLLLRATRVRCGALLVDDAQWAPDALAFLSWTLRSHQELPPLAVVVTVRDEGMQEAPGVGVQLEELLDGAGSRGRSLAVQPLPQHHRRELVHAMLGLERGLAARVVERTGGNPMFAVHLVGDWIQRGLLVHAPRGYVVGPDAELALPADLTTAWRQKVEAFLEARPAADGVALELAAVLGGRFGPGHWVAACARAGVEPSDDLPDALARRRLAERADAHAEVWRFTHGIVAEALERRSRAAGRWPELNHLCARVLEEAGADPLRVGRAHAAGGDPVRAIEPLLRAARAARGRGNHPLVLATLAEREALMGAVDLDRADRQWALGWLETGHTWLVSGAFEEFEALVARFRAWLREHPHPDLSARLDAQEAKGALHVGRMADASRLSELAVASLERTGQPLRAADAAVVGGTVALAAGRLDEARARFDSAVAYFEGADAPGLLGDALLSRGHLELQSGRPGRAVPHLERARGILIGLGRELSVAACEAALGDAARLQGAFERAEEHLGRAATAYRRVGAEPSLARCQIGRAEILRARGEVVAATRLYEQVIALPAASGNSKFIARLNGVLIRIDRGELDGLDGDLSTLLAEAEREERIGWMGTIEALSLATATSEEQWATRLLAARSLLDASGFADPDTVHALLRIAERATPERASEALELALAQCARIGAQQLERRVLEALDRGPGRK